MTDITIPRDWEWRAVRTEHHVEITLRAPIPPEVQGELYRGTHLFAARKVTHTQAASDLAPHLLAVIVTELTRSTAARLARVIGAADPTVPAQPRTFGAL